MLSSRYAASAGHGANFLSMTTVAAHWLNFNLVSCQLMPSAGTDITGICQVNEGYWAVQYFDVTA